MQNTNLFVFSPFLSLFLSHSPNFVHLFRASPGPLKANTNNNQLLHHINLENYKLMDTLQKNIKVSQDFTLSVLNTHHLLDQHGTPNLAEGFFSKGNFHDTVNLSFWDPNWQQARRSPKQSHHLRRHRRPGETVLVRSKVRTDIKSHRWIGLMVKAPTKTTSWKTILVHFGMASLQGPSLHHRRHCHVDGLFFRQHSQAMQHVPLRGQSLGQETITINQEYIIFGSPSLMLKMGKVKWKHRRTYKNPF